MQEIKHKGTKHLDVLVWPHVELDTTYTYDTEGNLTEVETSGLGFTKTITYTYTDGNLTGKTTIVTAS